MSYSQLRSLDHLLGMLRQLQEMDCPRAETFALCLRAILDLIRPGHGQTYDGASAEFLRGEGRIIAFMAEKAIRAALDAAAFALETTT